MACKLKFPGLPHQVRAYNKCKADEKAANEQAAAIAPCYAKCETFFPANITLAQGCMAGCESGKDYQTPCDYLEGIVGDQTTLTQYGIDCDPESGTGSALRRKQEEQQQMWLIIIVVIIITLFLLWFLLK